MLKQLLVKLVNSDGLTYEEIKELTQKSKLQVFLKEDDIVQMLKFGEVTQVDNEVYVEIELEE